jgi:hypothetical protein
MLKVLSLHSVDITPQPRPQKTLIYRLFLPLALAIIFRVHSPGNSKPLKLKITFIA